MDTPVRRRFKGFEFDVSTGELCRGAARVALERQPTRALTLLVSRAGQLVTREELRRAVWPGDVHVDFDRGLNYCLRQIRIALGDDAAAPVFIETVPRQGYRFIAALESDRLAARVRRHRWTAPLLAAAAALIVLAELGPRSESHHAVAVAIARAVHDFLF